MGNFSGLDFVVEIMFGIDGNFYFSRKFGGFVHRFRLEF